MFTTHTVWVLTAFCAQLLRHSFNNMLLVFSKQSTDAACGVQATSQHQQTKILKRGIGIESEICKQVGDQKSMETSQRSKSMETS